ncbi:MAG: YraN family protein [Phycisphaera sp.]|nr:MAG: YraN family protein [Phycisphaera sp.]
MLRFLAKDSSVGARGERTAARWLKKQGYRVMGRNVRVGVGEADIVCLAPDKKTIVIVEVKARIALKQDGPRPERNVGCRKQQKLRSVARSVARKLDLEDRPLRIDVVGIEFIENQRKPVVRHHPSAVSG